MYTKLYQLVQSYLIYRQHRLPIVPQANLILFLYAASKTNLVFPSVRHTVTPQDELVELLLWPICEATNLA